MLEQRAVPFDRRYRRMVYPGQQLNGTPTLIQLVMHNEKQAGLGVPLPAGGTALYTRRGDDRLLLGLGSMTDHGAGETIRLAAGISRQVQITQKTVAANEAMLTVRNTNPFPVTIDVPIGTAGQKIEPIGVEVGRIDGVVTWVPVLASGGQAALRYRY